MLCFVQGGTTMVGRLEGKHASRQKATSCCLDRRSSEFRVGGERSRVRNRTISSYPVSLRHVVLPDRSRHQHGIAPFSTCPGSTHRSRRERPPSRSPAHW